MAYVPFEFDADKSAENLAKHGIDFIAAQSLWEGKTVEVPSKDPGEVRRLVIGKIGQRYWTAIVIPRGENIRIISVRRSRETEKSIYEKAA